MKRIFMFLSICLFFAVSMADAQAYREKDRFTGEVSIYSTERRISLTRARVLFFYVNATYEGLNNRLNESPEDTFIMGCFQEWGHGRWRYLEYHDVAFLADGEPIIIKDTEQKGDVGAFGGSKLAEYVYFEISWANFLKLLEADTVEYRIGAREFKLKPVDKEEMLSFRDEVLK